MGHINEYRWLTHSFPVEAWLKLLAVGLPVLEQRHQPAEATGFYPESLGRGWITDPICGSHVGWMKTANAHRRGISANQMLNHGKSRGTALLAWILDLASGDCCEWRSGICAPHVIHAPKVPFGTASPKKTMRALIRHILLDQGWRSIVDSTICLLRTPSAFPTRGPGVFHEGTLVFPKLYPPLVNLQSFCLQS